jgi:hypothetical protein
MFSLGDLTRSLNCLDRVDLTSVTTSLSAVSLSVMSQNRVKASRTDFWTLPSFVLRLGSNSPKLSDDAMITFVSMIFY